jgi:hypothetical protein
MLTVLPRNPGSSGLSACLLACSWQQMLGWVDTAGAQQTGRNGQNDDVCEFPENRPSNPEYRDVRDSAL